MAMTDEDLKYWGEYGRMVNGDTVMLTPFGGGDIIALWNAFGALEEKVRNESSS